MSSVLGVLLFSGWCTSGVIMYVCVTGLAWYDGLATQKLFAHTHTQEHSHIAPKT